MVNLLGHLHALATTEDPMAQLVIVYHHPDDPDAFADYCTDRHLPFAAERLPGVRAAENLKVAGTPGWG